MRGDRGRAAGPRLRLGFVIAPARSAVVVTQVTGCVAYYVALYAAALRTELLARQPVPGAGRSTDARSSLDYIAAPATSADGDSPW